MMAAQAERPSLCRCPSEGECTQRTLDEPSRTAERMIEIIDHYDSFTYILDRRRGEVDPRLEIRVDRKDQITVDEILELKPERVIISPGPCTPSEAGISVECVKRLTGKLPLLGVCLGHQ